jgi:tetratricopeptide (TPR) repeat protein
MKFGGSMRVSVFRVWLGFLLVLALAGTGRAETGANNAEHAWIGLQFRTVELTPAPATDGLSKGLRIDLVLPGQPADSAGLHPDDVILYVNGKPTPDEAAYVNAIRGVPLGVAVAFAFIRGHQRRTADVRFKARPADYGTLWSDYERRCISSGQELVADAAHKRDYRTAFQEDLKLLRCASAEGNSAAAISAWNVGLVQLVEIVPKLRPAPPVPREAERHNQRALVILKNAARDEDIDKASTEFGWAVYEAPWLPDLYLNFALTLEKAGYPEGAIGNLRRYLLLKPNAGDAEQVRRKLTDLEVLAEERKPWLPFLGSGTSPDGAGVSTTLRGRKFVIRVANNVGANQQANVGDIILSAAIDGTHFKGKVFVRPNAPNTIARPGDPPSWIRCFGPGVMELDAEGEIEADGSKLIWKAKYPAYDGQSCLIARYDWQENTINPNPAYRSVLNGG